MAMDGEPSSPTHSQSCAATHVTGVRGAASIVSPRIGCIVRMHWSIENGLHWRLDVTLREDESRIRRGNAPHNIGVIRHVAMNLLKREKTKISYGKKRIRAALSDAFRHKLLMGR